MKVFSNFDLTHYNSYKIKSACKKAYFPESEADIISIYKTEKNTKKIILGGGYNIIFSQSYYHETFIIFGDSYANIHKHGDNRIEAEAGINMKALSEYAYNQGLTGLEIFYDIPSSLGGAIVMNAGASGEEIKDVLISVRYLDLATLRVKEISCQEIEFDYRNSFFQRNINTVILRVLLELKHEKPELIREKMEGIKKARWEKQPKEYPNAGSVFKRPKGYYVGTMIENLGLKGLTIGGAQVSTKHAGFIVNINDASGQNILDLITIIKKKVFQEYGVSLEVEQRII
ncbi:UDP-N-acetylmuramate dehydrogenase [Flavobacteriaceae bacterium TP-CH-4]|uniref:UDP-N-acetylenolpyruvoylglucosamine reductase n=1 Tax=Pelagihabitans pacificus TaxID=2696054 RepID=A0A967EFG1_9FLAO|nr:UDP-N-acetylmuramate dehydrogenase [Pelagihabitans pacificus]NHF61383.1 UDP-N-acetylmuramate dehydrogenase [Pelagihabitans pacificus]